MCGIAQLLFFCSSSLFGRWGDGKSIHKSRKTKEFEKSGGGYWVNACFCRNAPPPPPSQTITIIQFQLLYFLSTAFKKADTFQCCVPPNLETKPFKPVTNLNQLLLLTLLHPVQFLGCLIGVGRRNPSHTVDGLITHWLTNILYSNLLVWWWDYFCYSSERWGRGRVNLYLIKIY